VQWRRRPGARNGATANASETDPSFAVGDTARRSENRTSAARSILRQFRAAIKALLDDEPPPPAAKKRSGETAGSFGIAARIFGLRSVAGRAFRAATAMLSRSRARAAVAFVWEAFGPPDPCNPFDPIWQQPYTEDAGFEEHFADDRPPADHPSANL
jgi:hypothetical protein